MAVLGVGAFFDERTTPVARLRASLKGGPALPFNVDALVASHPRRCRVNSAHTRQSRPDSGLGLSQFSFESF